MPTPQAALSSRAVIGKYYQRLEIVPSGWAISLSNYFNSDQAGEDYKWLGTSPGMRRMIGGRKAHGLRDTGLYVKNEPFESTLEVSIDDLRRDKTGQILVRVNEHVSQADAHWAEMLTSLIVDGESKACYDGSSFFDTTHSEGKSGTQSNDISVDISELPVPATAHGSTTVPSPEELGHAILEGAQQVLGFLSDQGKPMNSNAKEFMVMVPTKFWKSANTAVGAATLAGGATNIVNTVNGFKFTVQVNPLLTTWTNKFAVFRTDSEIKPFIRQEEVPLQLSAIAEGSEMEFNNRVHQYGLYASRAVAFGYWQRACLVTLV